MSGTCSYDAPLYRFAYKRHIADDVKQFMTCALVVPNEGLVLDISQLCGVKTWYTEQVGKFVEFVLFQLTLIDNDSIIHITALDEVGAEQRLYVANEYEGTCGSNVADELIHIVKGSKLTAYELRVERAHRSN